MAKLECLTNRNNSYPYYNTKQLLQQNIHKKVKLKTSKVWKIFKVHANSKNRLQKHVNHRRTIQTEVHIL